MSRIYPYIFFAVILSKVFCSDLQAQNISDFQKQFEQFKQESQNRFVGFRDSVNKVYADYLAKSWEEFGIEPPKEAPRKPKPADNFFDLSLPDTTSQMLQTGDISVPDEKPQPTETIKKQPHEQLPSEKKMKINFYGTLVEISDFKEDKKKLENVGEKQVADYWLRLSQTDYYSLIGELIRLRDEMQLNDWALYQLLLQIVESYYPVDFGNEKTVFSVFVLSQMGYRVKMGRIDDTLVSLIAFQTELYGKYHIKFPEGNYYVFGNDKPAASQLYSYLINYENAVTDMDLAAKNPFRLTVDKKMSEFRFENKSYPVAYNLNLIALFDTWPQTELQVYAGMHVSAVTHQSLEKCIIPQITDRSEKEALLFLLSFVQSAFAYKTDVEQFGYEKYFFAEELFHYPFSDCDDRVVLFSQLVKRFMGLDVVLLDFSDHVATAVKMTDYTEGDFLYVNNERYTVCDPTYKGAPIGKSMVRNKNEKARVIVL